MPKTYSKLLQARVVHIGRSARRGHSQKRPDIPVGPSLNRALRCLIRSFAATSVLAQASLQAARAQALVLSQARLEALVLSC